MKKLDQENKDLKLMIKQNKEKKKELSKEIEECETQMKKNGQKIRNLEKKHDTEMDSKKLEKEKISKEFEELSHSLQEIDKDIEDLLRLDKDISNNNLAESCSNSGANNGPNIDHLEEFLLKSLMCPVCFETAEIPIYKCNKDHLIW